MLRKSRCFVICCALVFVTLGASGSSINAQEPASEIAAGSSGKQKSAVRKLTERVLRIERQLAIDPKKKLGPKIQVYSLKNAVAEEMVTTLSPLFAWDPTTIIVFDGRTNSVIARGSESELQILEALLLRFDEIPNPQHSAAARTGSVPRVEPSPRSSRCGSQHLGAGTCESRRTASMARPVGIERRGRGTCRDATASQADVDLKLSQKDPVIQTTSTGQSPKPD